MRNKAKVAYRRNTQTRRMYYKASFFIFMQYLFLAVVFCLQVSLPFLVVFFVVVVVLYLSLVAL